MKKLAALILAVALLASVTCFAAAEDKPFAGQTLTISTFAFNAEEALCRSDPDHQHLRLQRGTAAEEHL